MSKDARLYMTIAISVVLNILLGLESMSTRNRFIDRDNAIGEFITRELNGKFVHSYITPGTIGIVKIGKGAMICGWAKERAK